MPWIPHEARAPSRGITDRQRAGRCRDASWRCWVEPAERGLSPARLSPVPRQRRPRASRGAPPRCGTTRARMRQERVSWRRRAVGLLLVQMPFTATAALCGDSLAANQGAAGPCTYVAADLEAHFFPSANGVRSFVYSGAAWPAELLAMRTPPAYEPASSASCSVFFTDHQPPPPPQCGTWCEDNAHSPDSCDCGICGSYGSCSQYSCPTGLEEQETRLFLGQELIRCPAAAQAEMAAEEAFVVTEEECAAHSGIFTAASASWCEDGRLDMPQDMYAAGQPHFWAQRQRESLRIDPALYNCTGDGSMTIEIPPNEHWILQGGYTDDGTTLVALDARLSSGNLSVASNAGVVLRHMSISNQAHWEAGGAVSYHGGDGAVLHFEHVHFIGNAAKFGGAISIGDSNSVGPSYHFTEADGGLRVIIANCLFDGNTAYKYGALMVGDIWPLTLELRDSTFRNNGADILATDLEVGWLRAGAFDHVSPTYISDEDPLPAELRGLVPDGSMTDRPVHSWTAEQLRHHEPNHLRGHSMVRVHRCHFSANSYCHNGDCTNRYFNKATNVGYVYAGPNVLLNAVNHPLPLSLEVLNVTLANIRNGMVAGIGSTMHSGNLTATYAGGDASNSSLLCELAPYGVQYWGSSLVIVCDIGVHCHVDVSNSRWDNNGYKGDFPEASCNYAIGLGQILHNEGSSSRVADSSFTRQYAPGTSGHGGAVYIAGPATFEFVRCLFEGNVAGGNGAAILAMANLNGLMLIIQECVFLHNTVVPAASTAIKMLVSVFTGGSGITGGAVAPFGRPVWRIDDGPLNGNMSYLLHGHYTQYVDVTFGGHTLHHGLIPDRQVACTSWERGWIELVGVQPRNFVQFADDRAAMYNCSNSLQAAHPCPKGDASHILWSSTDFWVGSAGAAIYTEGSASVFIADSTFQNNTATVPAASIESHWAKRISIRNTTFAVGDTEPLAFKGMPSIDDCGDGVCDPGQRCTFARSSSFCIACADSEIGDGAVCTACAAGTTPNAAHTACEPCIPGTAGRSGLCAPCVEGTISAAHGSSNCLPCPPASVPNTNATACNCASRHYDRTVLGHITCTDSDFREDSFQTNIEYSVARAQIDNNLTCIQCPSCLDCTSHPIKVKQGFAELGATAAQADSRSFLRCQPETARLSSFGIDGDGFSCRGGELPAPVLNCRDGHAGPLCFECTRGYGKTSQGKCVECRLVTGAVEIGKTLVLFALAGALVAANLIGLGYVVSADAAGTGDSASTINPMHDSQADDSAPVEDDLKVPKPSTGARLRHQFSLGLSISTQPCKTIVSYFQIVGNIRAVLHIQFPAQLAGLIDVFRPLVTPVFSVVFECAGLTNFYRRWAVEVFVLPVILLMMLCLLFVYRRSSVGVAAARSMLFSETLLLLFVVYPYLTHNFFSMLNCRDLGPTTSRLVENYTIDCDADSQHTARMISVLFIGLFSFGVPIGLLCFLRLRSVARRKEFDNDAERFVSSKMLMVLQHDKREDVVNCIIDVELDEQYGTFVSCYKPSHFWYEPVECLRKMVVVGILAVVDKGSAAQVCAGIVISFGFFALHVKTLPFRYWEDNVLKATVEAHIFIVLLFALILKMDLHGESLSASDYDLLATGSCILMVPVAAVVSILLKCNHANLVQRGDKTTAHGEKRTPLQLAFRRYLQAGETAEDRSLLRALYSSELEALESSWHVFISYRVRTEQEFAKALCDKLSSMRLEGTRQNLRVYLDQERLKDGERWDDGFLGALKTSWIVVPVISTESIGPMLDLGDGIDEGPDNVLLELLCALELQSRGHVQAIMPIVLPSPGGASFDWQLAQRLSRSEHKPTVSIARKRLQGMFPVQSHQHPKLGDLDALKGVSKILMSIDAESEGGNADGTSIGKVSTAGIVTAVLRFQGVVQADRTNLGEACDRILRKAAEITMNSSSQLAEEGTGGSNAAAATRRAPRRALPKRASLGEVPETEARE